MTKLLLTVIGPIDSQDAGSHVETSPCSLLRGLHYIRISNGKTLYVSSLNIRSTGRQTVVTATSLMPGRLPLWTPVIGSRYLEQELPLFSPMGERVLVSPLLLRGKENNNYA